MNELQLLAEKHETDKAEHGYCDIYDKKLAVRRHEPLNVLEIGVYMGGSLRMWREYFPNATIHGLDINVERCGAIDGVTLHKQDAADAVLLRKLAEKHGPWDLIIDDASHTMKHQQRTFDTLWPHVESGGYYIIEDLHTSFMPKFELHAFDVNRKEESTFKMVEAFKEGKPFSSAYIAQERFDLHGKSVKHTTIWVREPAEHSHQLTSDNSITSMLLKA